VGGGQLLPASAREGRVAVVPDAIAWELRGDNAIACKVHLQGNGRRQVLPARIVLIKPQSVEEDGGDIAAAVLRDQRGVGRGKLRPARAVAVLPNSVARELGRREARTFDGHRVALTDCC